jgi:hypothetical protein
MLQRAGVRGAPRRVPRRRALDPERREQQRHMSEIAAWFAKYLNPPPAGPLRTADKTGHVSNYDESKVGAVHAARSADARQWQARARRRRRGRRSGGPS